MRTEANLLENLTAKVVLASFVVICLVLGLAGLILPIIPGVLFLSIAAVLAARHSPSLESWLRQSPTMTRYLDSADGFERLNLGQKIQFAGWLCLKMLVDGAVFVIRLVTRLASMVVDKLQTYH
jgi:uncharacterized membrane protein YbaN (DUF454 family)